MRRRHRRRRALPHRAIRVIYAAGDCTNHPSLRFGRRVRLESVDNAFEQAKTAALNLLDRPVAHDRVPWFWSDQFDNKLLIVGLSQDYDQQVLRGDPASRSFSVCYLKGRRIACAGSRQSLQGLHGGTQAHCRACVRESGKACGRSSLAQRRHLVPKIVFIEPGGGRREIDAPVGHHLMEAARQNGVQGIVALCGGACACATCHVYVDPAWLAKLEPREEMEEGMLESAWEPRENSRLSCQIHVAADLEGMQVIVPQQQALD